MLWYLLYTNNTKLILTIKKCRLKKSFNFHLWELLLHIIQERLNFKFVARFHE